MQLTQYIQYAVRYSKDNTFKSTLAQSHLHLVYPRHNSTKQQAQGQKYTHTKHEKELYYYEQ